MSVWQHMGIGVVDSVRGMSEESFGLYVFYGVTSAERSVLALKGEAPGHKQRG